MRKKGDNSVANKKVTYSSSGRNAGSRFGAWRGSGQVVSSPHHAPGIDQGSGPGERALPAGREWCGFLLLSSGFRWMVATTEELAGPRHAKRRRQEVRCGERGWRSAVALCNTESSGLHMEDINARCDTEDPRGRELPVSATVLPETVKGIPPQEPKRVAPYIYSYCCACVALAVSHCLQMPLFIPDHCIRQSGHDFSFSPVYSCADHGDSHSGLGYQGLPALGPVPPGGEGGRTQGLRPSAVWRERRYYDDSTSVAQCDIYIYICIRIHNSKY
jgi:hypothetical protein